MSDHCCAHRANSCHRLTDLAEQLALALMPTDGAPHAWLVRVCPPGDADGDAIGLLPLDGLDSPSDVLMGLVAPDDWSALGVVATAKARHVDRPERACTEILVVLLVDRTGHAVGLVPRLDGCGPYEAMDVTAGPEGVLLDLCRRALGLPTAPSEHGPMTWWAQLWLDAIVRDAAAEPGRSWTWPVLVARHPLVDLVDGATRLGPDRFARAVEVVAAGHGWERLRRAGLPGPDRDIADWMDEGCFARWTLGANPEPADLLGAVRSLLPAEAVLSVEAVLDRWGVLA